MRNHYCERWEGPIRGLLLPLIAWKSLQDEGITTIDHLTAAADRLERLVGIGSKMAQLIREELARVALPEEHPSKKHRPDAADSEKTLYRTGPALH